MTTQPVPTQGEVAEVDREAALEALRRWHRDSCYPEAEKWQLEIGLDAILAASPPPQEPMIPEGMAFRKKPVTIEAVCFRGIVDGKPVFHVDDNLPEWLIDALAAPADNPGSAWPGYASGAADLSKEPDVLVIGTLEGNHTANVGDWIIRGVKGELYPCKPGIFVLTYEPAPHPSPVPTAPEAIEAAARAMCDRVNGVGDYDANIEQRRSGWMAQAEAGFAAILAALHPPAPSREEIARAVTQERTRFRDAAKRLVNVTQSTLECNADDVRTAEAILRFVEQNS